MSTWPIPDEPINEDDIASNFWGKNFVITMSEFGPIFLINAENEQEAFDYAIDYAEDANYEGLLLSREEEDEEEYLDELIQGGNAGRYISSINAAIMEISHAQALKYLKEI